MSEYISGIRGRKLETDGQADGVYGELRRFPRADPERISLARRLLREVEVEGHGKHLFDTTTGETFEVITSFVDLADPAPSGASAFTVRDGLLVPLRTPGTGNKSETKMLGEMGSGRLAGPGDARPLLPDDMVVY